MMVERRWLALAAATAWALGASPSSARVVDYSLSPEAVVEAGRSLKITRITTTLTPHTRLESVATRDDADHITLSLAKFCSAYKVENPVSKLFEAFKAEWNSAGASAGVAERLTPIHLTVLNASSYRRCVEVAEMNVRCITKVKMIGTVAVADEDLHASPINVSGEAERDASIGGFCESMAKGIGVISREAAVALLLDAEHKIGVAQAAPPITPTPSSPLH